MATTFLLETATPLARSNAVQWGTHIRRRNRTHSDSVVAVVRSVARCKMISRLSGYYCVENKDHLQREAEL
jgi:hypothetical protein